MKQEALQRRLDEADQQVAIGEAAVRRQREKVAEMEKAGKHASEARALLASFERRLADQIAERNRLKHALRSAPDEQ